MFVLERVVSDVDTLGDMHLHGLSHGKFVSQPCYSVKLIERKEVDGRGGGIRTPGPLLPKQMRYQAALRPDTAIDCNVKCGDSGGLQAFKKEG